MNLKPVEIGILALSPRTIATEWTGEDQKIAHRLVKKGFLAADIEDPAVFRVTPEGEKALAEVLKPFGSTLLA